MQKTDYRLFKKAHSRARNNSNLKRRTLPDLRRRGLFRHEYECATLRENPGPQGDGATVY